jgi:hypothetical protein
MRQFHVIREINATPERVWRIMADIERWPEWTESISKIEPQDDAVFAVGSRIRVFQPKLRPALFTITAWEPNRGFTWTSKTMGLQVEGRHEIEATSSGSKVTLTLKFVGLLAGVIGFVGRRLTEHYMELEIEGLKARSEKQR